MTTSALTQQAVVDDGTRWLTVLTAVTALGAALVGGVFFAFSTFVMSAIRSLPAADGIAAMQAINRDAPNALFMGALFGTAALAVTLVVAPLTRHQGVAVGPTLACALYLVVIVMTAAYHVPRNDALAALDPHAPNAAAYWATWASGWTSWNHVRTLGSLAAAAVLLVTLRRGSSA